MTTRLQRARGALWGQAVGDALGTTVEFEKETSIAARPAGAWPQALVGAGPFGLQPGQVTDDTELALALARTLAQHHRYDDEAVAQAYLRWHDSGPFDIGGATKQAFAGPGTAAEVRARANHLTQANGSLMRQSPLALFGAGQPREVLAELAQRDSALSHPHQVPRWACAVFVTTLSDAIETGDEGPALYERALTFARGSPVEATLLDARRALPPSDGPDMGWVRIALQHAFFHLLHARDFSAALVQTVNKGGDTDTNAAIVGALLGGVLGREAIPPEWMSTVQRCSSPRPAPYRCADLDALAEALLA